MKNFLRKWLGLDIQIKRLVELENLSQAIVACDKTKQLLWKGDAVAKERRWRNRWTSSETIYFSPQHAPKWDVEEILGGGKVRHLKSLPAKEIEI